MNIRIAMASTVFTPSHQVEAAAAREDQVSRRKFCNRLLVTSSGLLVGASALRTVAANRDSQVAYPPLRIEGAEVLLPGSSLYFNYPSRSDPAILVRSQAGEYYAFGQKCSHMGCSVYFDRNRRCLGRGAQHRWRREVRLAPLKETGIPVTVDGGGLAARLNLRSHGPQAIT